MIFGFLILILGYFGLWWQGLILPRLDRKPASAISFFSMMKIAQQGALSEH
jgi:hypothetical protein